MVALIAYLKEKGLAEEAIPDELAVRRWISEQRQDETKKANLEVLFNEYPRKDNFSRAAQNLGMVQKGVF